LAEKVTTWDNGFTIEYNDFVPMLLTTVIVESEMNPSVKLEIKAIWDTGSHFTIINPKIAEELNLICVSKTTLNGIFGKTEISNMYTLNMYLPNKDKHNIIVTEAHPKGCDMLIGMDIISKGDFAISFFENKTTFSFRYPSIEKIDFYPRGFSPSRPTENEVKE